MRTHFKAIGLAIILLLAIVSKQSKKIKENQNKPATSESRSKLSTAKPESESTRLSNRNSYSTSTNNQLSNGASPYDNYFGKGVYNETQNSVKVKASAQSDVVFILIDIYSGKRIRNEYIRKGTSFELTKIPYGTYDYMYYSGNDWNPNLFNGSIMGGFNRNGAFTKNTYSSDRIEFERGYYGSYEITLYQVSNGNLETISTSSDDFFN